MKEYKFKKLTSKSDIENMDAYKEAIDFALNDNEISNIALTGNYGSGKSSVLETYKAQQNIKHKFIHISLSYFPDLNPEKQDTTNVSRSKVIEGKIVNQLLHQINSKRIPQTIFRVKNNINKWYIALLSTWISVFLMCLIILFNFTNWQTFVYQQSFGTGIFASVIKFSSTSSGMLLELFIVISSSIRFIYSIFYAQVSRKILKNISIKSKNIESNVEIFSETKDSYFDKYLDDVIYLFDRSDADIIVFEDIDRFDTNLIFSKLREINTLVNNRKQKRTNSLLKKLITKLVKKQYFKSFFSSKKQNVQEKMTFFYLLKDDLFDSKDRTKFFDFIIPVLPVINASNSYEKLKKILDDFDSIESFGNFNPRFLQNLSLYIDDMRLLKNIFNEFLVYSARLKNSGKLSDDKLLAIITYKNVFPKDFSQLQLNQGFVFQLFAKKQEYINAAATIVSEKINELQSRITKSKEEILNMESELYALYFKFPSKYSDVMVDGNREQDFESRAEFVSALRKGKVEVKNPQYVIWENISLAENFEEIEKDETFEARRNAILDKNKIQSDRIQRELKLLNQKKIEVSTAKLKDLITREEIQILEKNHFYDSDDNDKETFNVIKKNEYFDLLVFLITNGYIDEGYSDYITYFYPNSITLSDKKYLRSLIDKQGLDWRHKLQNISEIYDRTDVSSFSSFEILNFDLCSYLLTHFGLRNRNENLSALFKMIQSKNCTQFLLEFFKEANENGRQNLIIAWGEHAPNLLINLVQDENYSDEDKSQVLIKFIECFDTNKLTSLDSAENNIVEFISKNQKFIETINHSNSGILEKVNQLNIKFDTVPFSDIEFSVSKYIYQNNLYSITMKNVANILRFFHHIENDYVLEHKNYSAIQSFQDAPIKIYINSNFQTYLADYLKMCSNETNDDLNEVYSILNRDELDINLRESYLNTITRTDLNLKCLTPGILWDVAIQNGSAAVVEINILNYFVFKNFEWNKELIDFVNNNVNGLNFDNTEFDTDTQRQFFEKTVAEQALSDEVYNILLVNMKGYYEGELPLKDISDKKADILIDTDTIKFNKSTLVYFRNYYKNQVVRLVLRNLDKIDIYDNDDVYDKSELLNVLESADKKPQNIQQNIVNKIREPISIVGEKYNVPLNNYILINKFFQSDLNYVCSHYSKFHSSSRKIVLNIVKERLAIILTDEIDLDKLLINKIIIIEDISLSDRQLLFSRFVNKYNNKELGKNLAILNLNDFIEIINGKGSKFFPINDVNTLLLNYLHSINLISSYRMVDNSYKTNANHKINQIATPQ